MGSGVSKAQYNEMQQQIVDQTLLIDQLQQQLQQIANSNDHNHIMKNPSPQSTDPISNNTQMYSNKISLSIAIGSFAPPIAQTKPFDKNLDTEYKPRIEISAEVMHISKILKPREYVAKYPKSDASRALLMQILRSNVLFTGLIKDEIELCMDAFFPVHAAKDTLIIKQGDEGDHFYAVQEGRLEILVSVNSVYNPIRYGVLSPGMGFGELALLYDIPRAATIRAITQVELFALERNTFREILAHYQLERHQKARNILQQIPILQKLTFNEVCQVAAAMEWEEHEVNAHIIRQGQVGEHFYIITQGEIAVTQYDALTDKTNLIRHLSAGDHFGEMALLKNETRSATCTALSSVQCLKLRREHFIAMLGTIQELMDREPVLPSATNSASYTHVSNDSLCHSKYFVDTKLDELEILSTIGRGAFGRVKMVRHIPTNSAMALKCLTKCKISQRSLQDHVMNEKRVMLAIDHPFSLKLFNTFQDAHHLYFLVELVSGGELYTHLKKRRRLETDAARFYIASIVLVLQHLHEKSIAYRDIKPENILLDRDGFIKVADFGLAKVLNGPTYTLCGTPDYLAPELILSKGHGKAVDYWALGVLIYELLAGKTPFAVSDPVQLYPRIIQGSVKYPLHFDRKAIDLIQKLLCQNPTRRLGNMKHGIKDIIHHEWFHDFDWASLLSKQMTPPIIPNIENPFDTSNFEDFRYDIEDIGYECDLDLDF